MSDLGYRGPHVVLTPVEVQRIHEALAGSDDELAAAIVAKCTAAMKTHPTFREPLK